MVVDGETGVYVPVGDADALRGTITGLLDQPSAGAIGQQARDYCVQTADVHVYAERVAAALHDMVIGPRGGAAVPAR